MIFSFRIMLKTGFPSIKLLLLKTIKNKRCDKKLYQKKGLL